MTTLPQTTIQADSSVASANRLQLLALWQLGDRYQFLDAAYRYLAQIDSDPEIVVLAIKALCDLGFGVPARELLDQRADMDRNSPQTAAIRKSIAAVASGRVDPDDLREIFARNLQALAQSQESDDDLIQSLRAAAGQSQLFRSSDGSFHLSLKPVGGLRQWIPALTDFPELREIAAPAEQLARSVAIIGLTLTDAVERVFETTRTIRPQGRPPFFLIEPDLRRAAAWLHVRDRSAMLNDPRVRLFAGADASVRFERFLADNEDIEPPALRMTCCVPTTIIHELDAAIRRNQSHRGTTLVSVVRDLTARSRQRTPAQWLARIRPGSTVLGMTSRYTTMLQYSMRDIGHACEELGFSFARLIEREDHRQLNSLTIARAIQEHNPSLVILINHFRREQPQAFGDVPILTWVQDPTSMVLSKQTGASLGALDFVCGYCRHRCVGEFGYPPSSFFSSVIPVSTTTFHDGPLDLQDTASFECDLMYVGHLHHTAASHIERSRSAAVPRLQPLLDALYAEVRDTHDAGEHLLAPHEVVDRVVGQLNVPLEDGERETLANFYAYRLFDILYRCQTLHWAARWAQRTGRRFRLYGSGWSADPVLAPFASGPIEHGEPLRKAYRGARLVLQCGPAGFMHQRSFEGLASGSLVLTRFSPQTFSLLPSIEAFHAARAAGTPLLASAALRFPGLDRIVFHSAEEFACMADRYLADEQLRGQTAGDLRSVVLRDFTYKAVLGQILQDIPTHQATSGRQGATA